jgi:hypothetical protein
LGVIDALAPGDLVWIYEAQSGPTEEREEEGVTRRVRCRRGLKEIDLAVHERLLEAFIASSDAGLAARLAEPVQPGGFGPGGEGAPHRTLKEKIAADPSGVLGEADLRHVATELWFPTGDRIDVVLEDRYGRLVAVEVEVDCGPDEVCGPLQCMKYRGLLAYRFGRDPLEIRMVLAAHSVHSAVRERCSRFDIQIVAVSRA